MTTKEPMYLVQTEDGVLHAYWDSTILNINLLQNGDKGIRLYRRHNEGGAIRYRPMTVEEFKKEHGRRGLKVAT